MSAEQRQQMLVVLSRREITPVAVSRGREEIVRAMEHNVHAVVKLKIHENGTRLRNAKAVEESTWVYCTIKWEKAIPQSIFDVCSKKLNDQQVLHSTIV